LEEVFLEVVEMNMDTNNIEIKPLKEPIEIKLEQYECESCGKKSYINSEDKIEREFFCPFCKAEAKNIRIFDVEIEGIGEY